METLIKNVALRRCVTHKYTLAAVSDHEVNDEKPGRRWELSPPLGLTEYNYNVAELERGERLSENAYHYHENQTEFFHLLEGRCRVEVEDGSFTIGPDDLIVFEPAEPHLLHNPFDEPCRLIAIGSPPDGRYPVERLQSYEALLEERYGE